MAVRKRPGTRCTARGGPKVNKKTSREAWYARFFYPGLIAAMTGVFFWLARNVLLEALPFFVMAVGYGVLLTGVVTASGRAFMAMYASFLLIYLSFLAVEDDLGVPAAAPWFMGFIIGAIAGGPARLGNRAGSAVNQKRERTADGQGLTGGWQRVLINTVSALVLLGLGGAHLVFQSPTVPVAVVLGRRPEAVEVVHPVHPGLQSNPTLSTHRRCSER